MDFGTLLLIVSALWLSSEIALSFIKRSATSDHDKSSLRTLWIVIAASVFLGGFLGSRGVGRVHAGNWLPFVGLSMIVFGLVIRWIAILTLRKFFTVDVAIAADHKVVNRGLYKYVRHPAYAGTLLSFLGLGMTMSSWASMLVIFVPILWAFIKRIHIEEKVLLQFLGNDYTRYMASTKRLVPGLY